MEKERKMHHEQLLQRMGNVESLVKTDDFTVEQTVKEFKMLVTRDPDNCFIFSKNN